MIFMGLSLFVEKEGLVRSDPSNPILRMKLSIIVMIDTLKRKSRSSKTCRDLYFQAELKSFA
jgi:hypothetical protein